MACAACSAAYAVPEGPAYPSAAWTQREARNYARVLEAPKEQVADPAFVSRWTAQSITNAAGLSNRDLTDPSWLLPGSGITQELLAAASNPAAIETSIQDLVAQLRSNPSRALQVSLNSPLTPVCATYAMQCTGDPFRYPATNPFYQGVGSVRQVVFYDRQCTRLSGHVWRPAQVAAGTRLPGVVIETGSIEAPETLYWWAAQLLVRNGYTVMTFDVRGQGRSDFVAPGGAPGSDVDPSVFWTELVDAIDFFRSSPQRPFPNQGDCAGTYPTVTDAYNPYWGVLDLQRLGVAGHSSGGYGVSVVQAYGAAGAPPWPGRLDSTNPVKVAVAWDGLVGPDGFAGGYGELEQLNLPVYSDLFQLIAARLAGPLPPVVPRVPMMAQFSDYGAAPLAFVQPPDPAGYEDGFNAWKQAGVPAFEFTIQGASHYEWSLLPTFPATSWCPQIVDGACSGGWGNPMAQYYTLAWFDRWLKKPGEPGYGTADARLLDDAGPQGAGKMSFYLRSARAFPDRGGVMHVCGDIRAGCGDTAHPSQVGAAGGVAQAPGGNTGGGGVDPALLLILLALHRRRRG